MSLACLKWVVFVHSVSQSCIFWRIFLNFVGNFVGGCYIKIIINGGMEREKNSR